MHKIEKSININTATTNISQQNRNLIKTNKISNYFENINQTVISNAEMEITLKDITINPLY